MKTQYVEAKYLCDLFEKSDIDICPIEKHKWWNFHTFFLFDVIMASHKKL